MKTTPQRLEQKNRNISWVWQVKLRGFVMQDRGAMEETAAVLDLQDDNDRISEYTIAWMCQQS